MQITTIGLDIAKNVFQVHGIDAAEKVAVRKQLRRSQVLAFFKALSPCLIGMEACATAHYWARELTKLGHQVRLMPPKDVKAYVKRNKNDAADAEAICEAVRRPTMRFVQIKSVEQQGRLMLHRARDLLMRQRTQVINALRAHLAELGIVAAQGREGIKELLKIIASEEDAGLPVDAVQQKLDWFGTVRARIGYINGDYLWYVTGGGAYAKVDSNEAFSVAAGVGAGLGSLGGLNTSTDRGGWVIGGGVETHLSANWTAKLEALYMDLGQITNTYAIATGIFGAGAGSVTVSSNIRDYIFRTGLNYKF
jgi:opacity protein-like surface antigen